MTPRPPGAAALAMLLAAVLPGLGHAFLGRRRRAAAYFLLVTSAFAVGLLVDGRLAAFEVARPLTALAAVATWATGLPNAAARLAGWGAGDIASPTFEYGCTYLVSAGIMNVLLVLDAWDVATGRKP